MTRIIGIVNLSNHQGEDYEIADASGVTVTVAPGECSYLSDSDSSQNVHVRPVESTPLEPFLNEEGNRVFPSIRIGFPDAEEAE